MQAEQQYQASWRSNANKARMEMVWENTQLGLCVNFLDRSSPLEINMAAWTRRCVDGERPEHGDELASLLRTMGDVSFAECSALC
jgi:hypothetical protein